MAAMSKRHLKMVSKNLAEMERQIPFNEFKQVERWIPPPEEVQRNYAVIGSWGGGYGDGNSCDFSQSITGDIILLKGTGTLRPPFYYFVHAAIVIYPWFSNVFAVGADGERGVCFNSKEELWKYSHASVQRVNTWPLSTSLRHDAAMWTGPQIGKPYNWNFFNKWRRDAFYCSQLCWAAYWDKSPWYWKIDIDGIPDNIDFGSVGADAIWASWRTSTVTCSD